ncbi:hypothetical protein [Paenibacillus sp. NFR01]|uniref:hypothetical protein n=1 Tax=Paenibacillus sp. NFR01 TaxID=1566279 RepID=UPI0011134F15|nr:hypothetical protein [Paenibacillus sp. NFR01]
MNPADGRQEVVLSIASTVNKPIRPANEAFVAFYLTVKNELAAKDTAIHIASSGTLLEDSAGNAITDYGTTSANLYASDPKIVTSHAICAKRYAQPASRGCRAILISDRQTELRVLANLQKKRGCPRSSWTAPLL